MSIEPYGKYNNRNGVKKAYSTENWRAWIDFNGERIRLGEWDDWLTAVHARIDAEYVVGIRKSAGVTEPEKSPEQVITEINQLVSDIARVTNFE